MKLPRLASPYFLQFSSQTKLIIIVVDWPHNNNSHQTDWYCTNIMSSYGDYTRAFSFSGETDKQQRLIMWSDAQRRLLWGLSSPLRLWVGYKFTDVPEADHLAAGLREWGHEWGILIGALPVLLEKVIFQSHKLDSRMREIYLTGFHQGRRVVPALTRWMMFLIT